MKVLEGNFKQVDDVFKNPLLTGKTVYVDLWGTRCVPCIEEFAFNAELKEHFKNELVEYLYLAVDYPIPGGKLEWNNMISEHNLQGYHSFITGDLYLKIWESIKDSVETMHLIPHYLILDKNGKVAYANAARPSSKETLYKQIETVMR